MKIEMYPKFISSLFKKISAGIIFDEIGMVFQNS